jgi:hypothetical protein
MATYVELFTLQSDATLLQRVTSALNIASVAIFEEALSVPGHDRRVLFARSITLSTNGTAQAMLKFLLGKFSTLTVAQIQGATDAAIQTSVNDAINLFAVGF